MPEAQTPDSPAADPKPQVGPGPGTETPTPAPAGVPAAQAQPDGDLTAKIAALEGRLADYRVFDPVLGNLSDHPELVSQLLDGTYGGSAPAAGVPAGGDGGDGSPGAGEGEDPRFAAMERKVEKSQRDYEDLMLELGLDRGERTHPDDWNREEILAAVYKTGIADPEQAYFALRGQRMTPDYLKEQIADGVKAELARRAEAGKASPAAAAGQSSGAQPTPQASADEGLIGPAVDELVREEMKTSGMASPPPEIAGE